MNYSPADVIRYYLVSVTSLNLQLPEENRIPDHWPIHVTSEPPSPGPTRLDQDECVTIIDTTGMQDGRYMRGGFRVEHPGFQVRIRAKNSSRCFDKAKEIIQVLDAINKNLIDVGEDEVSYRIANVTRTTDITFLEEQPERRLIVYVFNAMATLTKIG